MTPVRLEEAREKDRFGGKAAGLGELLRAKLPVPAGLALSVDEVARITAGDGAARGELEAAFNALGGPVAVRSSAIGEDASGESFAGQHLSILNVRSFEGLIEAVCAVEASGRSEAARAYRARLGVAGPPRMGIVIQRLIEADCAGVLFTEDPMTGADERVIEAAWGLGEAVVAGLVTPDRYRVSRSGAILERSAGVKDLAVRSAPGGGTEEVAIDDERAAALCLDDRALLGLHELAAACERSFPGPQDLEWALAGGSLVLLQQRPITARKAK